MASQYASTQPAGFENKVTRVAIIGSGGRCGRHFLEALLAKGHFNITAIQRPDSTTVLSDKVHVVKADYNGDDDSQLVDALRGQQVLLVTLSRTAPPDTLSKIIRAAAKADVPFVLPNWLGFDDSIDALIQDTTVASQRDATIAEFKKYPNTAYFFLVCSFWYEFSLGGGPDRYGFDFKNRSFVQFDEGTVKINHSTWPQCGRAIANALSLKILPENAEDQSPTLSQFRNKSIYVSSFLASQQDMFESVKRVTGTSDKDWTITRESTRQRWEEAKAEVKGGNILASIKMLYSRLFFDNGDGDYESRRGTHNAVLGLPVEDLDEWTRIAIQRGEKGEI